MHFAYTVAYKNSKAFHLKKKKKERSFVEPFLVIYWTAICLCTAPYWDDVSSICQLCFEGNCSLHFLTSNYIRHFIRNPEEHSEWKDGSLSTRLVTEQGIRKIGLPCVSLLQLHLIGKLLRVREWEIQRKESLWIRVSQIWQL